MESQLHKNRTRTITCPRCQERARIPLYWVMGLEGVFRCRNCRFPFKTGYKMGAFLSGLGLCLSMAAVQLLVYVFSSYSLPFFILVLIPLWLYFAYLMRKSYLKVKCRRDLRKLLRLATEKHEQSHNICEEHPLEEERDTFLEEDDRPERVSFDTDKKIFEWDYTENPAKNNSDGRDPSSISKSELPRDTPFGNDRNPE